MTCKATASTRSYTWASYEPHTIGGTDSSARRALTTILKVSKFCGRKWYDFYTHLRHHHVCLVNLSDFSLPRIIAEYVCILIDSSNRIFPIGHIYLEAQNQCANAVFIFHQNTRSVRLWEVAPLFEEPTLCSVPLRGVNIRAHNIAHGTLSAHASSNHLLGLCLPYYTNVTCSYYV